jgi:hypothetical protein
MMRRIDARISSMEGSCGLDWGMGPSFGRGLAAFMISLGLAGHHPQGEGNPYAAEIKLNTVAEVSFGFT